MFEPNAWSTHIRRPHVPGAGSSDNFSLIPAAAEAWERPNEVADIYTLTRRRRSLYLRPVFNIVGCHPDARATIINLQRRVVKHNVIPVALGFLILPCGDDD